MAAGLFCEVGGALVTFVALVALLRMSDQAVHGCGDQVAMSCSARLIVRAEQDTDGEPR